MIPSGAGAAGRIVAGGGLPPAPKFGGPSGPASPGAPSPSTPGAPRPASPGAPLTPGTPGATTYTGPTTPFPPPGHPFSPFTDDGGNAEPLSWQVWWALNGDALLELRDAIDSATPESTGADFAIGSGQAMSDAPSLRLDVDVLNQAVLPAVFRALRAGGPVDLVSTEAVTVGRIGDPRVDTQAQPPGETLINLLPNPFGEVRQSAALGLGLLGLEEYRFELGALLENEEEGAELVGLDEVEMETRAFAAYALGLLARETELDHVRVEIAQLLVDTIDAELADEPEQPDVAVAATIALGLFQLPLGPPCECRGAQHDPASSRQAMLHYQFRLFDAEQDHPRLVRAHAATGMARTVEGCTEDLRDAVVSQLLDTLAVRSREPNEVQSSAILGLGLIADADADELDVRTREVLMREARHGDPVARRFALISMAQVAGRPGTGDPLAGTALVREVLLKNLSSGKAGLQSWSALALGLLGKSLREHGDEPSVDVDRALRSKLARASSTEDLGALALAIGLRRDAQAGQPLLAKLARLREPGALGYTALALGMIGEREAIEPLQEALAKGASDAHLLSKTAAALALLGDRVVADALVSRLENEELSALEAEAIASALGLVGDAATVAALGDVLNDTKRSTSARIYAAHSLGAISDAADAPWYSHLAQGLNYAAAPGTLANAHGTGVLNRR